VAGALKSDGTIWVWGSGTDGGCGQNNTLTYSSPVQIGTATTWTDIASSVYCFAALKNDGTVWSWGTNSFGTCGDGTVINRSSPVQNALVGWSAVYGGQYGFMGLREAGPTPTPPASPTLTPTVTPSPTPSPTISIYSLWGWGQNNSGQLGLNNTVSISTPVQIMSNVDFFCSTGFSSAAALKGGALYIWGLNNNGQLGNNTVISRSSPVQLGSETNWSYIYITNSACAIKSDNSLWMWGRGTSGQLGNNGNVSKSSPIQIAGSWSNVVTTWFDPYFTAGVKTDASLWG